MTSLFSPDQTFVVNRIAECKPKNKYALIRQRIKYLVVHETSLCTAGPDCPHPIACEDLDGPMLADTFQTMYLPEPNGLGTGGQIPYHFLMRKNNDATIEQMLPLSLVGEHGQSLNGISVAIALVGHFNQKPPLPQQISKLVQFCSVVSTLNGGLQIIGHTELPGTCTDKTKVCPGYMLSMNDLRTAVQAVSKPMAYDDAHCNQKLAQAGIIIN